MLSIIEAEESKKWDSTVKSFANYDVYYLNAYSRAFAENGCGEPILIYFDNGKTRAINVVMKRDISADKRLKLPPNTYFDLSTPYGYGGFLVEGDECDDIENEYEDYCKKQNFVCEFVRFQLFYGYHKFYGGVSETRTHNIVRSLDMPLDEMMYDFEHKVRKNLKKAAANNLRIEADNSEKNLKGFLHVYYDTMKRTGAKDDFFFSEQFFHTIDSMQDNIMYFNVFSGDEIISSELVLYDNTNCYSYLGGTISKYFDLRPNEFLKFEIIKWAKEKGLNNFVLGGGYGSDDGIFRYKKALAPNGIVDFYIGKRIFNKKLYDELTDKRRAAGDFDEDTAFFPKYRG
ncbi:MAG: GNAT family N-acetyltransferase [Firmicutes bacterium]|nr:GNAT family N-acetyltransferase [Bacillota bacterium]